MSSTAFTLANCSRDLVFRAYSGATSGASKPMASIPRCFARKIARWLWKCCEMMVIFVWPKISFTLHRIERPETGVVRVDALQGNALFEQRVLHIPGLVVSVNVIVPADYQVVHFSVVIEFRSGGDA